MRVPARRVLFQRRCADPLDALVADRPRTARARLVAQPFQPVLNEPRPPLARRRPRYAQLSGNRSDSGTVRAGQDDPRPQRQSLRGLAPPHPPLKDPPLIIGQHQRLKLRTRHDSGHLLPRIARSPTGRCIDSDGVLRPTWQAPGRVRGRSVRLFRSLQNNMACRGNCGTGPGLGCSLETLRFHRSHHAAARRSVGCDRAHDASGRSAAAKARQSWSWGDELEIELYCYCATERHLARTERHIEVDPEVIAVDLTSRGEACMLVTGLHEDLDTVELHI